MVRPSFTFYFVSIDVIVQKKIIYIKKRFSGSWFSTKNHKNVELEFTYFLHNNFNHALSSLQYLKSQ